MKKFRIFLFIVILFVIFFILSANSYAHTISNKLSDTFFRLHIIANSDSKNDQELKLKIRDEIIKYMEEITISSNTKEEIKNISTNNITKFQEIAENVILENGYNYSVNVEIGNYYFPTKKYGNISLPAGNYDALRIEIGDAIGQNWWCSLFPPLCFIDISSGVIDENGEKYLKENLSQEELYLIKKDSTKINFKFKIVEYFNSK